MTTRALYSAIGVSGYEHQSCRRKDGVFHIRMEAPQSSLPNVVRMCSYTKAFARHVVDLRKINTIRDVARKAGVSDTMIRSIDRKYRQKKFC